MTKMRRLWLSYDDAIRQGMLWQTLPCASCVYHKLAVH